MKKALVLAGGGTRGAYQAGAIRACMEMGRDDWDLVTGVSVGALNAALVVQGDIDGMIDMYDHLSMSQIINGANPLDFNLNTLMKDKEMQQTFLAYIKDRGLDISPFIQYVHEKYNPEKFFASRMDFGLITATRKGHEGVYVNKAMMKEHGEDWLIASASAYPAFPVKVIDGVEYIDGGYFDNCPIDYALRMGAEDVLVLDMNHDPNHPNMIRRSNIHYVYPKSETGDFLDFSHEKIVHLYKLGANDVRKIYGVYMGLKYTLQPYGMPRFFKRWYIEMEKLETRIKLASNINDRFRSDQLITDRIKEITRLPYLTDRDYFEAMLDQCLDLAGADEEKVFTLEEARNIVFAAFADCVNENYVSHKASLLDKARFVGGMDHKSVISHMVHAAFYPDHQFFSENTILTLYPFEQSIADFIVMWMKEFSFQNR
ncbi:MAG: patatin-like phospholipase family protein [Solobacterium sp.]|jgi:predicted acylesterase/phospholipase RssA|nr:patatin-like phospholipase family protein [Solobacterium sp.]MCH4049668.1 patatin-like phospholipase family protein [Solobacterium sp.]MCH4073353.1 patatin-like phospholipase family protein [Solobacterium sp.]MCI1313012.1 patatin-like phospholipase family protein [Solobacterium sp.]MCI1345555.1 patatin-like phospholipase family protein [Solobacterium sp.]